MQIKICFARQKIKYITNTEKAISVRKFEDRKKKNGNYTKTIQ